MKTKAKALIVPVVLAAAALSLAWSVFDVSTGVRMVSALVAGFVIGAVYDAMIKAKP